MTGETLPIPTSIIDPVPGEHFLLKVDGDSMAASGIAAGDWTIVRKQSSASDGDVVASMVDGDAIVTTFRQADACAVFGVVVTVLHRVASNPEEK
jgi:repressor LexA